MTVACTDAWWLHLITQVSVAISFGEQKADLPEHCLKLAMWRKDSRFLNYPNNNHRAPSNANFTQLAAQLICQIFELVYISRYTETSSLMIVFAYLVKSMQLTRSRHHSHSDWFYVIRVVVVWELDTDSCHVSCIRFSSNQNIAKTSSPKCEITLWINHNGKLSGKPYLGNEISVGEITKGIGQTITVLKIIIYTLLRLGVGEAMWRIEEKCKLRESTQLSRISSSATYRK